VPVLVLPDGRVIDESVDIMHWALARHDPDDWWCDDLAAKTKNLVEENDFVFKKHLDQYK
jgi:glutathione S-transferase